MENLKDLFGKAFNIANENKYRVIFFIGDKYIETKEMTYMELGKTLVVNSNDIEFVKIVQKE